MTAYSASPWPCSEWKSFPPNALMTRFFTEINAETYSCSRMLPWGGSTGGPIKHSQPRQASNVTLLSDYR